MLVRELRGLAADAERIERFSTSLESQVRRLEELVADLLDVSRIEQGRLSLRRETADLEEIMGRARGQFDGVSPDQWRFHPIRFVPQMEPEGDTVESFGFDTARAHVVVWTEAIEDDLPRAPRRHGPQ